MTTRFIRVDDMIKEKGSVRYYGKKGIRNLIRIDYYGAREVPTGPLNAVLKAARLKGEDHNC
ncbi:MAG: type II toxin-antitoxin system HicA family toxin [Candidatus Coatesbacteria bacterium]|nr:type II toxin-antitoxin system HicA family toxin [Candidatus Coatesbacteria bacterium]